MAIGRPLVWPCGCSVVECDRLVWLNYYNVVARGRLVWDGSVSVWAKVWCGCV